MEKEYYTVKESGFMVEYGLRGEEHQIDSYETLKDASDRGFTITHTEYETEALTKFLIEQILDIEYLFGSEPFITKEHIWSEQLEEVPLVKIVPVPEDGTKVGLTEENLINIALTDVDRLMDLVEDDNASAESFEDAGTNVINVTLNGGTFSEELLGENLLKNVSFEVSALHQPTGSISPGVFSLTEGDLNKMLYPTSSKGDIGLPGPVGSQDPLTTEEIAKMLVGIDNPQDTEPNMVDQPHHYIGEQGLEVETVLQNFIPRYTDAYVAHRIASALEYLLRSPLKNGIEDIEKARKNLSQALEYMDEQDITK